MVGTILYEVNANWSPPAIGKGDPIEKGRAPLTNDARRKADTLPVRSNANRLKMISRARKWRGPFNALERAFTRQSLTGYKFVSSAERRCAP